MRANSNTIALVIHLFFINLLCNFYSLECQQDYEWAIFGAGPAGIIVVGLLMDLGVDAKRIVWVDREFSVGSFNLYNNVPANSTVQSFIDFLHTCKTFSSCKISLDALCNYGFDREPSLGELAVPLQEITNYLCTQVIVVRECLQALNFDDEAWHVAAGDINFSAKRVVLATGSHPRSLDYNCDTQIPLDSALDKSKLAQLVKPNDTIAVIGSAHSAILAMKFLSELNVGRIINFYNKPLQYVEDMGSWALHAESGLKGIAAQWAREVLEKNQPPNLMRIMNCEAARTAWLPICNKIIYAAGFERNDLPPINGSSQPVSYDSKTGVIGTHLFGIGIAFPELQTDPLGNSEYRIGLNSFINYAQRVIPEWMNKDLLNRFRSFEDLFIIDLL